jgi:hypothetical protein
MSSPGPIFLSDPALIVLSRAVRRAGGLMIKERPAALIAALLSWTVIGLLWSSNGVDDATGKALSIVVGVCLFVYALAAIAADVEASAARRVALSSSEIEEQIARLRAFLGERAARVAFAIPGEGGARSGEPELAALRRDVARLAMEVRDLRTQIAPPAPLQIIDERLQRMADDLDDKISECVAMAVLMAEKRFEQNSRPTPPRRSRVKKSAPS